MAGGRLYRFTGQTQAAKVNEVQPESLGYSLVNQDETGAIAAAGLLHCLEQPLLSRLIA